MEQDEFLNDPILDVVRGLPSGTWIDIDELAKRVDPTDPRMTATIEALAVRGPLIREGDGVCWNPAAVRRRS